jgi:hypothetical protein
MSHQEANDLTPTASAFSKRRTFHSIAAFKSFADEFAQRELLSAEPPPAAVANSYWRTVSSAARELRVPSLATGA